MSDEIADFLGELRVVAARDQMVLARARDAVPEHIRPGSLSYVAFVWTWLIDELARVRAAVSR